MIYKSKRDKTVTAKLEKSEEKYGTVMLEYLTGPDTGKVISITKSTLKRWWEIADVDSKSVLDTIDYSVVNTPYPEPKKQRYIKKPKSVIEYEEKKKSKTYNSELPTFDEIVNSLGSISSKVNEKSSYIKFKDGSTLWRKCGYISMYTTEALWVLLTNEGLMSSQNKDKARPFAFTVTTKEAYDAAERVLKSV